MPECRGHRNIFIRGGAGMKKICRCIGLVLLVMLGGALGAVCRVQGNATVMNAVEGYFPFGVLCINITGSFCMGALTGWLLHVARFRVEMKAFLGTGFLGGFTTFSSFAWDTAGLAVSGHFLSALLNIGLNGIFCVGAAGLGWVLLAGNKAGRIA